MKFEITSFQSEPDFSFKISHLVDSHLGEVISNYFSQTKVDFDLVFSISCSSENTNKLLLTDQIRGRSEPKTITQFVSLPNQFLIYCDDWILDDKSFDFKHKKMAYRSFPASVYAGMVVDGLRAFFFNEGVDTAIDFAVVKQELMEHFTKNEAMYRFMNEELIHLKELIEGTHHSFHSESGKDWQESEPGQKWMRLSKEYTVADDGSLVKVLS